MTALHSNPEDKPALWPFACALYEAPGVREAAIMLQDRHAVDVNLLLFACWRAGFDDGAMREPEMAAAIATTRRLQEETIRPLRAARRAIRKGSERETERRQLLDLELAAEKAELSLLEKLFPAAGMAVTEWDLVAGAASANMRSYIVAGGLTVTYGEAVRLLEPISFAAADVHRDLTER